MVLWSLHYSLPPSPPTVVHVVAHWYNYERFAALYNLTDSVEGFAPLNSQPIPAGITSPIAAIRLCFTTCKAHTRTHTHTLLETNHCVSFASPPLLPLPFCAADAGVTGHIMVLVLFLMVTSSVEFIR